jgi:hypothetical protein
MPTCCKETENRPLVQKSSEFQLIKGLSHMATMGQLGFRAHPHREQWLLPWCVNTPCI